MTDEQLKELAAYLLEFVKRVSDGTAAHSEAELKAMPIVAAVLAKMPRF